ncbi:hypothetical protein FOA43_003650 [Brettanomyces nanus]|uniref:SPX domain-containing protein n=1 Tax=Eeniella nana TaxID=13502 RepID=A0A875SBK0_EENNA|nr:uncharacterized protein FOA43_003650 [Brettanomyces nanus]QPG76264.1 hypothetical protein FOA43_003650 [Brettanomyces nanus]
MKFGSEMNDRSIERRSSSSISLSSTVSRSGSTDTSVNGASRKGHLERRQKRYLKDLYAAFKEQINFVSLFVNSKYGEISRRILATKKQLNAFINSEDNYSSLHVSEDIYQRMTAHKFLTIHKELEILSTDLQDLSRFILLQKIALKKLFKKFLKHSMYTYKQELVDKITSEFLVGNPDSFFELDLSDAAMELTLLFDVVNNYYYDGTALDSNGLQSIKKRYYHSNKAVDRQLVFGSSPSSLLSIDFPQSIEVASDPKLDRMYSSRVTAFDIVSHKKAPVSQVFWIHNDNLAEIRFLLLREFKLISDDTGIVDEDTKVQSAHQLKKTESSLNLMRNQERNSQTIGVGSSEDACESMFRPDTQRVSFWLANLANPKMTATRALSSNEVIDSASAASAASDFSNKESRGDIYPCDIAPQVTYSDFTIQNVPLIIAPLGGLRQFTLAPINQDIIKSLMGKNFDKSQLIRQWRKSGLMGNLKVSQLTLDWFYDENMVPLAKVKSDRIHFIDLGPPQKKIECYLTLDSNVRTSKLSDNSDLGWSETDEVSSDVFPHSILEIRYDSPLKSFSKSVQLLIDSHLVYRVDNLGFSLNNYLFAKYYASYVPDNIMLEFVAPWYEELQNKDIRKLPSLHRQESGSNNMNSGILLNKNEVQPQRSHTQGYWNEFDYGSDLEDDDAGFYVYEDGNNADGRSFGGGDANLFGFNFLTPEKVEAILGFANKVSNAFGRLNFLASKDDAADPENRPLMSRYQGEGHSHNYSYSGSSSRISSSPESDSEAEFCFSTKERERQKHRSIIEEAAGISAGMATSSQFRPNELARQVIHDKVLTCLYFSLVLISYLIDGAGIGIVFSVIRNTLKNPDVIGGNSVLIGTISLYGPPSS